MTDSKFPSIGSRKKTAIIIIAVAGLLTTYFTVVFVLSPQFYLSLQQNYPKPEIVAVNISDSQITLGRSFEVTVVGANKGVTADMQTLSISFPNLTRTDDLVSVRGENFTQHPLIISKGQEIGSHYQGNQFPVFAQYPSIEAFNRPWIEGDSHFIMINVKPDSPGRFVIFVKSVVLPYSNILHYPTYGIQDQQSEFVIPHSVTVTNP